MRCNWCGCELCDDDIKSELSCSFCWELFEAEYDEYEERE